MMDHIILAGDSIFDNAPYAADGHAVVDHLKHELRGEAEVTLLAVDGSFANEVPGQLRKLPGSTLPDGSVGIQRSHNQTGRRVRLSDHRSPSGLQRRG
jgi:Ni,Fe-hydrogenase maturation factor